MKIDNKNIKYLYIATTRDKYELPIAVADSARELAQMLNMPFTTVKVYLTNEWYGFHKIKV